MIGNHVYPQGYRGFESRPLRTMSKNPSTQGFALWREAMRWQRTIDAALRPLGLTHTRFLVLDTTALLEQEMNDAVSQREIAQRCELDESTVSNLARRLTEDGLLDRGPNGVDARAWRVIVSPSGHRVLRRARAAVDTVSSRFFKPHRSA